MIWVEAYYRIRDGFLQHVRGHWRSLLAPGARRRLALAS